MLQIRPARPDELDLVADLTIAAYLPALAFGTDDPYRATLADTGGRAADAELLVAVEGDRPPTGTITLCRPGSRFVDVATPDELEVRMLAVDPTAQRNRVGATLMEHAHAVAAAEGFAAVVLSVIDTNDVAAAFYRRLGYQRVPQRDWTPVPHVRLLVWRRPLPRPGS